MNYRTNSIDEIAQALDADLQKGLTEKQVEINREKYGKNEFEEQEKPSLLSKIIDQFKEVMNAVLVFAGFLSLYIAAQDPSHGFSEPIVIFIIIFINIFIAIYQEGKAEDALESLKKLSSPASNVIRDGKSIEIESSQIVQGDILLIEAGQQIGADIRLFETNNLQIDEASLTGESVPVDKDVHAVVEKDASIGDIFHTAFSGTNVTNGNGKGIVIGIGMSSEMGSVAGLLDNSIKTKTPLQKRIDTLAKQLAVLAFFAGAVIFILNYYSGYVPFFENLMTAVSLAIAAVPETLPVIVTLGLAHGVENMVSRHAIIRNMPAVETLGSASVIASDKTGTLTQNKMTIQRIWSVESVPSHATQSFNEPEEWLLKMFGLASNAYIQERMENEIVVGGDPTEAAIVRLLEEKGWSKAELDQQFPRVYEIPFDSTRKRMTTIHEDQGSYLVITKGAFDRIFTDETAFEKNSTSNPAQIHDEFAENALRVLGLSYKRIDSLPDTFDDSTIASLEADQIFSGIVGMIDPPREESSQAVQEARDAGIRPIMITGDHALTAAAIAKEIGIYRENDKAITGAELEKLSDEHFMKEIENFSVYARVSPEDKIRIVKAWQDKGEVVAMTGDGVNDAPSLQAANVGTAMGQSGTEVAKNASDMILTDDNFATIVHAVEEGRRVYANIKKAVYYLLSANVAEIALMLIATLIGWGNPLVSIQLLFINVLADGIPGFGLTREIADEGIMKQDPIGKEESIFSKGGYRRIFIAATTFTIISLFAFYLGAFVSIGSGVFPAPEVGQTMTFLVLGWSSTIHIFVARSNDSIFKIGFTSNGFIFWTVLLALLLTTAVAAIPFLAETFYLVALTPLHWAIAAALSVLIILVVETEKLVLKKMGKTFLA